MATVRLQARYWKMVYHGIQLAKQEEEQHRDAIVKKICSVPFEVNGYSEDSIGKCFQLKSLFALYTTSKPHRDDVLKRFHMTEEELQEMYREFQNWDEELYQSNCKVQRYVAIARIIEDAMNKKDGFFSSGIGPDRVYDEDLPMQDDEEKMRWIEQID